MKDLKIKFRGKSVSFERGWAVAQKENGSFGKGEKGLGRGESLYYYIIISFSFLFLFKRCVSINTYLILLNCYNMSGYV